MSGDESSVSSEEIRYLAHERARPGQLEMIHDCLAALQAGGHHLAAAPPGIGKTAAALADMATRAWKHSSQKNIIAWKLTTFELELVGLSLIQIALVNCC